VLTFRQDPIAVTHFHDVHHLTYEDLLVVFASEPMSTTFGEASLRHWGYNEQTILSSLVQALNENAEKASRRVTLIVRPHPKERREHFLDILGKCRNIRWIIDTDSLPWILMNRADLVCGMSSMFLIESVILRRPVMSIQIGLCRESPFVLDRQNILKSVLNEEELHSQVKEFLIRGKGAATYFEVILDATQRIISEMEKLLCLNSR